MVVQHVANVLTSPIQAVYRLLSSRLLRSLSIRGARGSRYRPKKNFTLPVIEYSHLSALYFAIDQAVQDDEVRCVCVPHNAPH